MKTIALLSAGLAATLIALLPAAPAQAQLNKTFVSDKGSDGNDCTFSTPCRFFQRAHDVTGAGGTITCLDSGDFASGITIITKSITIDCAGTSATAARFQVSGAGIVVAIRNLTLTGSTGDLRGIQFLNGAALFVENCVFESFGGELAFGIDFQPTNVAAKLAVTDTVIRNNGSASAGGGIRVKPLGAGSARAVLNRVTLESNTHGIIADGTGSSGSIVVQVRDSVVAGGIGNGIWANTNGVASGIVVHRTSVLSNAGSGILAQGAGAVVHIGNSSVVGNGAGLNTASGGQILSYQNNEASGNVIDGGPTGVLTVK